MENVFSLDEMPWMDVSGLPGARGFEFKPLTNDEYTKAYSCELIRLGPSDHSVPHIEPWSHLLYVLSGTGDIVIDGHVSIVGGGTVCQVRAGEKHSLRNLGEEDSSSWRFTIRRGRSAKSSALQVPFRHIAEVSRCPLLHRFRVCSGQSSTAGLILRFYEYTA